ncbi:pyruvate kinase [Mesorhizobium sp. LjNodule214]|uniref:pyruvate kinase n=1 Tax=Mesorhizobium sp. LjNodule214 TaxID=3342252 RepID=UPI003ECF66A3
MKAREVELLCTLGPASLNDKVIHWLDRVGTSLLRLNLSHTKIEDLERIITFIQKRTRIPICLDTEGAQVRTGPLVDGKVTVHENRFLTARARPVAGDQFSISFYPAYIINKLQVGDFISIDFNAVLTQVVEKDNEAVILRVLNGGELGQNKAVTVQRTLEMPPLTEKDLAAIAIGRRMGIRHFALSFAHRASDVDGIRAKAGAGAIIISKIECLSGLRNLAAIAEKSDAILIDRGDLSREVPIEQIPAIQKMIIRNAKAHGAKVYVATNLLESMTSAPTPTRAEVNDVYNTLADGADGLVLAAETAIGQYPVSCARMVIKVAEQFRRNMAGGAQAIRVRPSSLHAGVEPHGGRLVIRTLGPAEDLETKDLPMVTVTDEDLTDVEQIARGTFSPLCGFMDKACLESVLERNRLPSGLAWTMPVVLAVPKETASRFSGGERVLLCSKSGLSHSVLDISETYGFEPELLARKWFGTDSREHPGVARVLARGGHFLAGSITLIQPLPSPYRRYDLTPAQLRTVFAHKGWTRVVAFHSRNLVHRVHEVIQMAALERTYADGLLINPVVGNAKRGDFMPHLVLDGYQAMLDYGIYPPGKVVLASFITYPRFAGPREAVFTALCRKNMGCSHFIIGRDHSGVGGFYGANESRELFDELGDIGIEPIFFDAIGYDTQSESYVDLNACKAATPISGSEIRRALRAGEALPNWMMRSEVQEVVRAEVMMKHALFQE